MGCAAHATLSPPPAAPLIADPVQATTAHADALTNLGEAAHIQGDLDRAADHQARALAIYRAVDDTWGVVVTLQHLADIERDRGNIAPALERYSTCLGVAYEAGDDRVVAACLSGAGCIAAMGGQAVVATRLFAASEANLERAGIPVLLPTDHNAREHWLAECRHALDADSFASEWSAGRALNRDQIAEVLASIRHPEAAEAVSPLSRRELEVLRLLASGLSDRAIGEALYIGERTVNTHVARTFAKLGVRNRAAAVAAAVAAGLIDPPANPLDPE